MRPIRFFDYCAGLGAFRTGFANAGGYEPVGWCEIDKTAQTAYRALYQTEGEYFHDDARTLNPHKLYARYNITDTTDYSRMKPTDYPIMSDFYELIEKEFMGYDRERKHLYTEEMLQEICLGLHSMCVGAESKYFNGHTNIVDDRFLCFGVKGLMDTNKRLKDTMLFNILSYMSNQLLGEGSTVASVLINS